MRKARKLWLVGSIVAVAVATALVAGFAGSGTAAQNVAPSNTAPPTISGTPQEGQTLTANNGTWSGTQPMTFTYQWRRCDDDGGSCSNIGGATERTYQLRNVDVGRTLRVRVTARNADGSATATSVPTAVIRDAPQAPAPRACDGAAPLQIATISPPERLSIDGQSVSPNPILGSTQSLTVRIHVSCRGKAVQGALVYVTAVPFNQFSIPNETQTGADGWAQMTMNRLRGFPANPGRQQLVAMFVRARKGGEDVLGGVSTRRLISFPLQVNR
jgi:hypothetical protein